MGYKRLITAMAVLLIAGVFLAACVYPKVLPDEGEHGDDGVASGEPEAEYYVEKDGADGDYTILIDAGHGGVDPGKTTDTVQEKDINLSIARKLEKELSDIGYNTIMTRTEDVGLYQESDKNKKRADLKKRCEIANGSGADIMVSIHQNSFSNGGASGAQVFYYTYSAAGKELAGYLQQSFKENLDVSNKRVEKPDKTYYLLLHSGIPTVIAECGFITNAGELGRLLDEDYQERIVEAIIIGINKYFAS